VLEIPKLLADGFLLAKRLKEVIFSEEEWGK